MGLGAVQQKRPKPTRSIRVSPIHMSTKLRALSVFDRTEQRISRRVQRGMVPAGARVSRRIMGRGEAKERAQLRRWRSPVMLGTGLGVVAARQERGTGIRARAVEMQRGAGMTRQLHPGSSRSDAAEDGRSLGRLDLVGDGADGARNDDGARARSWKGWSSISLFMVSDERGKGRLERKEETMQGKGRRRTNGTWTARSPTVTG